MAKSKREINVAVNTMRARLTILGFNLAIITFQIANLPNREGGVVVPGLDRPLHIPGATALYFALLISIVSMVCFIASNVMNEQGTVDHWAMLVGDVLMYLGLAHTVMGFSQPLLFDLAQPQFANPDQALDFETLRHWLAVGAMIAWIFAAYVGPLASLFRSPFGHLATVAVGFGYAALLFFLATLWSTANELQATLQGVSVKETSLFQQFFAPIYWITPTASP